MINAGDQMPSGSFGVMAGEGPATMSTDELFSGKKVVVFSVPGAFTPTCSRRHLPGFIDRADEIFAKGVDTIACTAVNDVFVMDAWGRDQGAGARILMLADGNGDYVRALGLDVDSSEWGMGIRGRRFAIIVNDGTAAHVAVDEAGQFNVSSAAAVIDHL